MSSEQTQRHQFKVVIAGGGVAGLEAAMALRGLAGERIAIKLLAPNQEFVYRPQTVREPFAYARADRYPLAEVAEEIGVELVGEALSWADPSAQLAYTPASALHYDALLVASGARPHARYEHALTIDDRALDEQLHGLIQDVEEGYVDRVAFVIPSRIGWPLPIYELALMTANRAREMNVEVAVTVVTPEESPLTVFGSAASDAVSKLLARAQIDVVTSAYAEIPVPGRIRINPGHRALTVDRVVALPELLGPALPGLPADPNGFLPTEPDGRVHGVEHVYAAGDATDFPVKHGGVASQQAAAAAHTIAAAAGLEVEQRPFHPVIRGMLLTGTRPLYLKADITGGHGFASEVSYSPLWEPAEKISAERLGAYLQEKRIRARAAQR